MKRKISQEGMVELAFGQLLMHGYHKTNVREVMQAAGLNKGSFANYFPNKEQMAVSALEHFTSRLLAWQQTVDRMDLAPMDKVRHYFAALIEHFDTELHCQGGCLVGNFSSELADTHTGFQTLLDTFLVTLNTQFATWIAEAQQQGDVAAHWDPAMLAELIMMTWEGAVLRMKSTGKIWPLQVFRDTFLQSLTTTTESP